MKNISGGIENQGEFVQIDDIKDEISRDCRSPKKQIIPPNYNDYYEWMGRVTEVRPITITEDVEFCRMSHFQCLIWWLGTGIQMLTLTILSLRTDRLAQYNSYLKYHWKHYSGMMY